MHNSRIFKGVVSYVGLAIASALITLILVSSQISLLSMNELRSKWISIAAVIASQIDLQAIAKIRSPQAIESPEYHNAVRALNKALQAAQNGETEIRDIYTLALAPSAESQLIYGVDGSYATSPDFFAPGTPYVESDALALMMHLHEPYIPPTPSDDQWGVYYSVFVPMLDERGQYIATLSIDVDASSIHILWNKLYLYGSAALLISLSLAIITAYFCMRTRNAED